MSWEWFTDAWKAIFGGQKISVTVPIEWTGVTNKTMRNLPQLLAACYDGINNPDLRPQKDANGNVIRTFCNIFVDSVAQEMGCHDFMGKMANEMIDVMSRSVNWTLCPIEDAQSRANLGSLLIATEEAQPHGHVCVIVPGIKVRSIHWSMAVPLCANVGKDVFIGKGLSFAFREVPKIWLWRPSI